MCAFVRKSLCWCSLVRCRECRIGQGGWEPVDDQETIPWRLELGGGETVIKDEFGQMGGSGAGRVFCEEGKHCNCKEMTCKAMTRGGRGGGLDWVDV